MIPLVPVHRWFGAGVLAAFALVACEPRAPQKTAPVPVVELEADDGRPRKSPGPLRVPKPESTLFVYAELVSQPGEPPERHFAPLPSDIVAAQHDWVDSPPPEIVAARLCRGDAATREIVRSALDFAAATGAKGITAAYREKLGTACARPGFCAWAREHSNAAGSPAVREFFWYQLEHCHDDATRQHFAGRNAPFGPLMAWMLAGPSRDRDARFLPGLRKLVRATTGEPQPSVLEGLYLVAIAEDDATARAATKLYGETKHPQLRAHLLRGFARNPSPVAQAFFAEHCTDADPPDCDVDLDWRAPQVDPFDDIATTVRTHDDVPGLWRDHPDRRRAIETALGACALDFEDDILFAEACLIDLARIDRPAAVDRADALLRAPGYFGVRGVATLLQRFPGVFALEEYLDALGLEPRPDATPDPNAVALFDVLVARGRALAFDPDDGVRPHRHHVLLDELASLMSPDLDGVVFEQRAPHVLDGQMLDPDEGYTLIAYMDGQRHEVVARDFDDWLDLAAVYGFLNALARTRGAPSRIVASLEDGVTTAAIAGPQPALEALATANLLRVDD